MTWLAEQPVTIFALGLVTLAIMAGALVHTGRRIFLYAVFAVVLLTAGMLLIERLAVTEVERVEATLYALANDLRKNDAEAVLQHISTGSPDVLMDAKRYLGQVVIHAATIKRNLTIVVARGRHTTTAQARFNGVLVLSHKNWGADTKKTVAPAKQIALMATRLRFP